jgi:hypothetical protein
VGFSSLSLRLVELQVILQDAHDNSTHHDFQNEIEEFRRGLEVMRTQRRDELEKMALGALGSLDPNYIDLINWLQNPATLIPDSQRESITNFISKGETYG